MRGRSHRFQSVDAHDDWVDGSWTVDCVCGVTFDDGEEMVNCDECGVWVHTRCSKYVKGEESFACDKCKSKNNRNSRHNDSEETEVAQLLVELPTKTVRLESSYSGPATATRPIRLWTDIPMENRVHVQGIPGGDPELFNGLSSVFRPELWKCTGYVPKKFNFQYKEFPCWVDKEGSHKKEEENDNENENPVDKGAGMLFSLSKESVLTTPMAAFVGMRGGEECGFEGKMLSKEMKWESKGVDVRCSQNGMKKGRSLLRPVVVHSGKRKKDDLGMSKDRNGKKKARALENEADERKKGLHTSRTVCRSTSDAKHLEFYEDRDLKSSKTDIQGIKNKNLQKDVHREPVSDGHLAINNGVDRSMNNIGTTDCPLDALSSDFSRHYSNGAGLNEEVAGCQVTVSIKSFPTTEHNAGSMLEQNDTQNIPVKQEGDSMDFDKLDDILDASARSTQKPFVEDLTSVAPEVGDCQILKDLSGDMSRSSVSPIVEVKTEVDNDNSRGNLNFQSSPGDAKVQNSSYDQRSEIFKVNDLAASSSQSNDHKALDAERTSEAVSECHIDKANEVIDDPRRSKLELEGLDDPLEVEKSSPVSKQNSGTADEQSRSEGSSLSSQALTSHGKTVVSVVKSVSLSSNTMVSKSSASENLKPADTQNSNLHTKQRVASESNVSVKKDRAVSDVVRHEEKHDIFRKSIKEHPKSSVNSLSKVSHSNRILHATVSKRTMSDSKDSVPFSSSKSSVQNVTIASGSVESTGSLQSQCALHVQNKISTSGLPLKSEKLNQSNTQPSSKVNHAQSMHPPAASNSPATLSDEELALLLHQELNSSPRVPRVPRVRHAGSLPQLSSPTATSMLMKRSSSSGGKDHSLVSRRKNKDTSKDAFRSSRELDDETRKVDKVQSSPDLRRQDTGYAVDVYTKRDENGSPTAVAVHSVKKNMSSVSTTANSGPSSSTEVNDRNVSSIPYSPRNISDDDTGTDRGPIHRTLPGLINDIMSKGRRMTYEELCNAVLPHWPHLRKHNGERYAYSSHSQAVLDCLRNRHEWARLVDRGPKTNSSRKRRKLDADESEDNEYGNGRTTKEAESKSLESQREEFPKGKRKARKRRRLALQGRGIKDVRRRRKTDLPSDDEAALFSNSSEESMFSEDETNGGGACPAGSEASASSDEAGTT